jgi:hypothetical protein
MSDKQVFLTIVGGLLFAFAIVSSRDCHNCVGPAVFTQRDGETTENQHDLLSAQTLKSNSEDAIAFASFAEREIAQLDNPTTLGGWLDLHGKDERWVKSAETFNVDCVSFVRRGWLPSGAIVGRAVYFYPPQAPSPAVLPKLRGQELLNTCTLGEVRVEAQSRTAETGHKMAQALEERFARNYGSSVGMNSVPFWGRGYYAGGAARWIHNDSEIVSGYDAKPGRDMSTPDEVVGGPVAFVHARLPIVYELEHEACCTLKAYRYRSIEKMEFQRAASVAGVGGDLSLHFEKLYEEVFQTSAYAKNAHQPEHVGWLESLVPALRDWFTALKTLKPAQRAAGLFAADRLVAAVQDVDGDPLGHPKKPHPRSELQELGAVFEMNEFGGFYEYKNNWLEQARELDPDGEAGQMAMLVSLARPSCDPRKVILDGEQLLKKGIDVPTATQLHFIVGDAYSDIVALAEGPPLDADYDPAQFRNDAGSARTKALDHYRAGLAVDPTSENAKDAWRQAWHLSAGLVPSTRNVCVGD